MFPDDSRELFVDLFIYKFIIHAQLSPYDTDRPETCFCHTMRLISPRKSRKEWENGKVHQYKWIGADAKW